MFKFLKAIRKQYSEIPQVNPIRWEILYKQEDGVFAPQTGKFKCKDFFNDIVAKYNGMDISIYGMDTSTIKLNDEGVYVRLSNIYRDNSFFLENIERLLNGPLREELGVEVTFTQTNTTVWVAFLPRELFKNTYIISLVTYLIRVSNIKQAIESWDVLIYERAEETQTLPKQVLVFGFKVPEKYQDFWYFSSNNYNSKDQKHTSLIHNNGIHSWLQGIQMYGGKV